VPLVVVKKDGSRQSFDKQKILNSMLRACDKRSVSLDTLERAVSDIEQRLLNSMDREIPTDRVGELVMEALRGIDQVAYVRFASVYRQFQDIDTFMSELNKLLGK
jgi:transcriptional repressor NrdR